MMKRHLINTTFSYLEEELKKELDEKGILRLYKKNEVLVTMGQPIDGTYIILNGFVKMYRENKENAEFMLSYLQTGQSFAVSISSDSTPKNKSAVASVSAMEPTYVLKLSFDDKDMLAKKFDSWYKYILQTAVMHYGLFLELIDNIAFQKLDTRLQDFLTRLRKMRNNNILKISHQQIANDLNASRESVSRLLKKMEEAGKIIQRHNEIEIINLA